MLHCNHCEAVLPTLETTHRTPSGNHQKTLVTKSPLRVRLVFDQDYVVTEKETFRNGQSFQKSARENIGNTTVFDMVLCATCAASEAEVFRSVLKLVQKSPVWREVTPELPKLVREVQQFRQAPEPTQNVPEKKPTSSWLGRLFPSKKRAEEGE